MSKAEEKTTELMKKAKDFIPDGGYSEKELNLAFFMFIKGYLKAEKDNELTWEDMECIIKHYQEIMAEKNRVFVRVEDYQEVLERFKNMKYGSKE